MSEPDQIVAALAHERDNYLRSGRPDRIIPVDEQLALRGWCVDKDGNLRRIDDKRTTPAPKHQAAERRPGRTRKVETRADGDR